MVASNDLSCLEGINQCFKSFQSYYVYYEVFWLSIQHLFSKFFFANKL